MRNYCSPSRGSLLERCSCSWTSGPAILTLGTTSARLEKHIFTIKHDVNQGFSVFSKEFISTLLKATAGTKVTFEAMSPNSVTFTFEDTLRNLNHNNKHTNNALKSASQEIPIRSSA